MFTPGIGPATVGLRGVELFDASQAANANAAINTPAADTSVRAIDIDDFS
jgi:hypothetical protein